MTLIRKINIKDMTDRLHHDEAHAMAVAHGSRTWHVVVGDDLVALDPMIGAKVYEIRNQFKDGSNRFSYKHKDSRIQVYVWIEKSKQYIALGTRKDVVGEIGEEETAKIDALYEEMES